MAASSKGRPVFDSTQAASLAEELYGIRCEASELASYSDQNFRLTDTDGVSYVLKIANAEEPAEVLDFQQGALLLLGKQSLPFKTQHLYESLAGEYLTPVLHTGRTHQVWMISFLEGTFMAALPEYSASFLNHLGQCLGHLDKSLEGYNHPHMHRNFMWDLQQIPRLTEYLHFLDADGKRMVSFFLERYEKMVTPIQNSLRKSVIYNDANDHNILVRDDGEEVVGFIDFGDMVYSYTVCELAIAGAYALLDHPDPLGVLYKLLEGYASTYPMTPPERKVYFHYACLRLCTSVCLSAERRLHEPDNAYLAVSEKPAWNALRLLSSLEVPEW